MNITNSDEKKTINYIQNQEEHHRVKTFHEEYKLFLDTYGINLTNKAKDGKIDKLIGREQELERMKNSKQLDCKMKLI